MYFIIDLTKSTNYNSILKNLDDINPEKTLPNKKYFKMIDTNNLLLLKFNTSLDFNLYYNYFTIPYKNMV